ncbi:PAS domain S-box protein [Candidatus Woesearchaeota archaeon]|nr:PAS domain S-box protein [Candidatus Woesearchaeota archaeon]
MSSTDDYAKIIQHITDAVICVDLTGTIIDWNKAAESLLGYASYEIINQHFSTIYPKQWHHQIPIILHRIANGNNLSNVNAQAVHKNGGTMPVNLSFSPTYKEKGSVSGFCLILRKLDQGQDIHIFLEDPLQQLQQEDNEGESKRRTFEELRLTILTCLSKQQMTINQLATYANINWKTVENHLTYLLGKGFVREVFKSDYVRIFETTPLGKEYLARVRSQGRRKSLEEELP